MLALRFKQFRFYLVLTSVCLVFGCAQPAHKNTMPWNLSTAYTEVRLVAPNKYLLDGLYLEIGSLRHWLTQRQQAGIMLPLLLKTPDELNVFNRRNYFELATVAQMAEELGFEVYLSRAKLLHLKTTSEELMLLSDRQNTPEISED